MGLSLIHILYEADRWVVFVFPREKHRPACYTAEGEANLLSSPASVDLGGVFTVSYTHLSHGWYYEPKLDRWEWQRARIFQTVEDLYTQSYVCLLYTSS